jgi:hypothetical protein
MVSPPALIRPPRLHTSSSPPLLRQVAAYCDGRSSVGALDLLLLQHVLWTHPQSSPKIADWVLSRLSADGMTEQVRGW